MSSGESSATGVGSLPVNEDPDDNEAAPGQQQQLQQQQQQLESGSKVTPGGSVIKLFLSLSMDERKNRLECLSLANHSNQGPVS